MTSGPREGRRFALLSPDRSESSARAFLGLRRFPFLAFLLVACAAAPRAAALEVYPLFAKNTIDFSTAGADQKVGSFLVVNPDTTKPPVVVLTFANACTVEHFRRPSLAIPLTEVKLLVRPEGKAPFQVALWSTGNPCGSFTWQPANPSPSSYASTYQVDILVSWAAVRLALAGTYSESISVIAYTH